MKFERSSGILLHPTSLPGPFGIGDLGPQAYRWIDFLGEAGCTWWQVLPLGPTGFGDSPYQSFSAFACNPYLISPEILLAENLLEDEDLGDLPAFPEDRIDFGAVIQWKINLLDRSFYRSQSQPAPNHTAAIEEFRKTNADWLEDFALFMALKDAHDGAPWHSWEAPLRKRDAKALKHARSVHQEAIQRQIFRQYLIFSQWNNLHEYARERRIRVIGDLPIFVSHDSADVWVHTDLFFLKKNGKPKFISGVPPDYFSPTGQLWGNPLYRWKIHRRYGYDWWISRLKMVFRQLDMIRLDHFRGFAGYWEVPGNASTAEKGRWVSAPGMDFFKNVKDVFGDLPIIAEDLGVITPDVVAMREKFGFPGMKILQFAFSGNPQDAFLPHHYSKNCVVYTGTHDNDTALGWYERVSEQEKGFYRQYLDRDGSNISWDLIRSCWASVADFALAPMQDFLDLDNRARMNYPGNPSGNWQWRMPASAMNPELKFRIHELNFMYSRLKP